jgi:hypothetical protein
MLSTECGAAGLVVCPTDDGGTVTFARSAADASNHELARDKRGQAPAHQEGRGWR